MARTPAGADVVHLRRRTRSPVHPTSDAVARFAAVLVAVPIVLLVAGIAPRLYGRGAGLAAGRHLRDDARGLLVLEQPRSRHLPRAHRHRGVRGVRAIGVRPSPRTAGVSEPARLLLPRPFLVALFFALLGAHQPRQGRDLRHRDGRDARRRAISCGTTRARKSNATSGSGDSSSPPRWRWRGPPRSSATIPKSCSSGRSTTSAG